MLRAPYIPCETDAEQRRWMDIVVMLLETGSPMAEAMSAARRVIVFTSAAAAVARRRGSGTYAKTDARDTIPAPSSIRAAAGRRK
jgi:hypothetical protein